MGVMLVPLERRAARISEGLPSSPSAAAIAFREFEAMPLKEFFGSEVQAAEFANVLAQEGVDSSSTLGEAMVAFDRIWRRSPKGRKAQKALCHAGATVAKRMACVGGVMKCDSDPVASGTSEGEGLRAARGETASLESRIARLSDSRSLVLRWLAGLDYSGYWKAVDEVTECNCAAELYARFENDWDVDENVSLACVMKHVWQHVDDVEVLWLLDSLVVMPLARLHGLRRDSPAEAKASEVEVARKIVGAFAELPMGFLLQGESRKQSKLKTWEDEWMVDLSTFSACARTADEMMESPDISDRNRAHQLLALMFEPFKGHCAAVTPVARAMDRCSWLDWVSTGGAVSENFLSLRLSGEKDQLMCFYGLMRMPRGLFRLACGQSVDKLESSSIEDMMVGELGELGEGEGTIAQMCDWLIRNPMTREWNCLFWREIASPFARIALD